MPGILLQALFLAVHNTNKVLLLMNVHSSWRQKKIKKCLTSHVVVQTMQKNRVMRFSVYKLLKIRESEADSINKESRSRDCKEIRE